MGQDCLRCYPLRSPPTHRSAAITSDTIALCHHHHRHGHRARCTHRPESARAPPRHRRDSSRHRRPSRADGPAGRVVRRLHATRVTDRVAPLATILRTDAGRKRMLRHWRRSSVGSGAEELLRVAHRRRSPATARKRGSSDAPRRGRRRFGYPYARRSTVARTGRSLDWRRTAVQTRGPQVGATHASPLQRRSGPGYLAAAQTPKLCWRTNRLKLFEDQNSSKKQWIGILRVLRTS